jgi:hypothetical protein
VTQTQDLEAVSRAIESALVADLPDAMGPLLAALDARAAAEGDVQRLLASVPPLARSARYGSVRQTDTERLAELAESVLVRGCAALGAQVACLDDDASEPFVELIEDVQRAVRLLPRSAEEADRDSAGPAQVWQQTLSEVADRRDVAPLLVGRITRMLFDVDVLDAEAMAAKLSLALSSGHTPAEQARWIEGLLRGDALLLIHDQTLLGILDSWIIKLSGEEFVDILPLLRRTFGTFQLPERRAIEQNITRLEESSEANPAATLDLQLAEPVLATVRQLLGWNARGLAPAEQQSSSVAAEGVR